MSKRHAVREPATSIGAVSAEADSSCAPMACGRRISARRLHWVGISCRPKFFPLHKRLPLNRIVVIVLVLLAAGAALAVINSPPEKGRAGVVEDDHWRKTADGWQRNTNWFVTRQRDIPAPHPIVVASFQVLLSVFALLFWPARAKITPLVTHGRLP